MIVESTPFSIIHEGYKLNTIETNEVIIETIPLKNQVFSLKVTHPYIIETEEIICDQNNLYIIYPNYKIYNKINIKTQDKFNKFFNEIRELIKFIVENKIDIEPIKLSDIYEKKNIYVLLHKKQQNKTNIKYGSPIYSPPEIYNKKNIDFTEHLIWNVGMLLYQIIKTNSPYTECKDVIDVINMSKVICFEETEEDQFLKKFLNNNILDRISYLHFLELDITKYNFFKDDNNEDKNYKNDIKHNNKIKMQDDMFDFEMD
jgi:hypothetical protein